MKKITLFIAVICTLIAAIIAPVFAHAANTKIAIVDMKKVVQESTAATALRNQLNQKRDQYKAQIEKEEQALKKAEKQLQEQRSILAPDAFATKQQEFRTKLMDVQRDIQKKRKNLDTAFNPAFNQVDAAVQTVIAELASEKGFNVAVPASLTLYAETSLDITNDVLKKLNEKIPTVKISITD